MKAIGISIAVYTIISAASYHGSDEFVKVAGMTISTMMIFVLVKHFKLDQL